MPRPSGVSLIFVNSSGEVLLFLRDDLPTIDYPNCWDLLGGHVEPGEAPDAAIAREIREELNYAIDEPPRLYRATQMADRDEYTYQQAADFDIDHMTLYEGQRLKWFSEAEIRSASDTDIAFNFRGLLIEFFNQIRKGRGNVPPR